jgi:lysophospholipase L1-like esterase
LRSERGRRWLGGFLLALTGCLLAAGIIEISVRLFKPVNLDFYNWQKIKRVAQPSGTGFEFIPGGRNDFYVGVPVQINSFGLRDVEIEVPKPADTVRVLVVGDSLTFGFGVELENTYLKVLESELNATATRGRRFQVVNGGMDGTGLDRHLEFIRSRAPHLQPDLVIVAISLNDIVDYRIRGSQPDSRAFSERSPIRRLNTFLLFHSQAYLSAYMRLKSILYRTHVLNFGEEHWYEIDILKSTTADMKDAWDSTEEILSDIVALARERHYPLMFVVFPMEIQLNDQALELYRRELQLDVGGSALSGNPQLELRRFGASLGVPVLDLLPAFRAASESVLFLRNRSMTADPVHPSVTGHRLAAQALYRFLQQERALSAPLALVNGSSAIPPQ